VQEIKLFLDHLRTGYISCHKNGMFICRQSRAVIDMLKAIINVQNTLVNENLLC